MNQYIDFLNKNSGAVQAIMVIVLVAVTIWYAISTKSMAVVMRRQLQIAATPYLFPARDIKRVLDPINNTLRQLRIDFANVGTFAVEYEVNSFVLDGQSINPRKIRTVLFPQQSGTLTSELLEATHQIGIGDGLRGSFAVVFWTHDVPEAKYVYQREFQLVSYLMTYIESEVFHRVPSE